MPSSLKEYKRKRDFKETKEPKGKVTKRHRKLRFVVQKHAASRLHYDFRLEIDGVLKSWAVPKGPSMNPDDRRLAVQVEDHPFDYRNFEGDIPAGNYGAGQVIIWDEGTYKPLHGKEDTEKALLEAWKRGRMEFDLDGKKLKGGFSLFRMHTDDDGKNWLLVKKLDANSNKEDITRKDRSVRTGKRIREKAKKV